jgi:hypothetical protein
MPPPILMTPSPMANTLLTDVPYLRQWRASQNRWTFERWPGNGETAQNAVVPNSAER